MPLLEEQLLNEIKTMSEENPKNIMFSAKLVNNNQMVGHIQLLGIDRKNMSARIGRVLIGEKEFRGKGIGLQMVNSILDIAFNEMNLHRVDWEYLILINRQLPAIKRQDLLLKES